MKVLVENASELIEKGKPGKARRVLVRAEELGGGESDVVAILLARVGNATGDFDEAVRQAQRVLVRSNQPGLRAAAGIELAHAVVFGSGSGEMLAPALGEVRAYLDTLPGDDLASSLRVRLCAVRRELPLEHSSSLDHPRDSPTESADGDLEVTPPMKIVSPQPVFPSKARSRGPVPTSGSTVLRAIIALDGCVTSLEGLDPAILSYNATAKRSVRHWVFRPAQVAGEPVTVWYNLTVNFRLR